MTPHRATGMRRAVAVVALAVASPVCAEFVQGYSAGDRRPARPAGRLVHPGPSLRRRRIAHPRGGRAHRSRLARHPAARRGVRCPAGRRRRPELVPRPADRRRRLRSGRRSDHDRRGCQRRDGDHLDRWPRRDEHRHAAGARGLVRTRPARASMAGAHRDRRRRGAVRERRRADPRRPARRRVARRGGGWREPARRRRCSPASPSRRWAVRCVAFPAGPLRARRGWSPAPSPAS